MEQGVGGSREYSVTTIGNCRSIPVSDAGGQYRTLIGCNCYFWRGWNTLFGDGHVDISNRTVTREASGSWGVSNFWHRYSTDIFPTFSESSTLLWLSLYIYKLVVKNLPANAGDARERSSISVSGRSPGVGNGNPLLYSCLENSTDRGAWWAPVHGAAKSWTWLSDWVHAPRVVYSDPYQRSLSRNHLVAKNRNPFKVTRVGRGNGIYWKESGLSKGKVHQSSWMRRERGELGGGKSKKSFSPLSCYILVFSALCASVCAGSFSDFHHRCLALPFVCKEDSVCPQPDFSRTVQASNTIAQHRLSKDGERRLGPICVMAKLGFHHQIWGGK